MFHGAGFLMALAPVFFGGFVELLPSFNIEQLMLRLRNGRPALTWCRPTSTRCFAMGERAAPFNHGSLEKRDCRDRSAVAGHEG